VPFEEDDKDSSIWFLDHSYHEQMYRMCRRINAKESVVGWYSTGPKVREADLDIHEMIGNYVERPVLVVIDVQPQELGLPTSAYMMVEEVAADASGKSHRAFAHLSSEVGAFEAEEIGVEHLLRDVKDATVSTLATRVSAKLDALRVLEERLCEIRCYMDHVLAGRLPANHDIMAHLQEIFNLLPNLAVTELVRAFAVKTNDAMLVLYVSSIIRSVTAVHNLLNNLIDLRAKETALDAEHAAQTAAAAPAALPPPATE